MREITKLVEDFYADGKTAFVFTADHGMSDWGSHGDGHPDNTRTPLIAWGSGVAKPKKVKGQIASGHEDGFSGEWGLDAIERHDVAQADIAALMAYLAGLEFPVNSVGELPLSYLAANDKEKAEAALVNAKEVLEMYRVKEARKQATQLRYQPFAKLGDEQHSVEHRVNDILQTINRGEYDRAIRMSQELLHVGLDGLRYLQTYDWLFLRVLVSLGYLGWIAFSATTVIDLHVLQTTSKTARTVITSGAFGAIAISLFSIMFMQKAPFMYYAYALFPLGFWEEVVARREALALGSRHLLKDIKNRDDYLRLALQALGFVAVLEALVSQIQAHNITANAFQVLSYSHRTVYTVCFTIASFWPFLYGRTFAKSNKVLIATWVVACLCMGIFTLLPAMKTESTNLMYVEDRPCDGFEADVRT